MDEFEQDGGTGTVRVVGTWFIAGGLLVGLLGLAADIRPSLGFLFVIGIPVFIGVGLRIEAALRGITLKVPGPRSAGVNSDN